MDDIHQLAKADKLEVGIDYWRMLANRRLEILKSLEWVVSGYQFDDDFFCPYCHAKEWTKEHKPDCALAKELSDATIHA